MFGSLRGRKKLVDDEHETNVKNYMRLQEVSENLQKSLKSFQDSMKAITQSHNRMAACVDEMFEPFEAQEVKQSAKLYAEACQALERTNHDLESEMRITLFEPMTLFMKIFPIVDELLKKRDQKLIELEKRREKLGKNSKSKDRGSSRAEQAERAVAEAEREYNELNDKLRAGLPGFCEARTSYFDACFEALVKIQLQCSKNCQQLVAGKMGGGFSKTQALSDAAYDQDIRAKLDSFLSLAIVSGSSKMPRSALGASSIASSQAAAALPASPVSAPIPAATAVASAADEMDEQAPAQDYVDEQASQPEAASEE
ncbi:hypothetical protein CAOG_07872 [Capsaspora owczarzaki ATCC 30864]|uniref:BAR domain-containing protein n=1 Tax=Capsaspora owczarzaki (strain ATCC 30864) TaxID=595528 RepID=A0A0D2X5G5_CAPO3|nr:hypothetical protein CAOG_07872 [Capsaspora owczarzaki ATCC 30864]KJE97769.1 hypothetical protein CAOG_007872 [Capsaspora owczarzaki ATCC 30864]|eukprot:XP_004342957.1 hypothetical protein CAOG_07872 [Capsaspora owczarzaki ATCC 30864]